MNDRNLIKHEKCKYLKSQTLFEFIYYIKFINSFLTINPTHKFFYFQKILIWCKNHSQTLNNFFTSPSKYERLSLNFTFNKSVFMPAQFSKIITNYEIKSCNFKTYFFLKLINLLFLFNNFILDPQAKLHFNYKLLFGRKIKNNIWINNGRFIHTWLNGLSFIYNIFYFSLNPLVFGSVMFKNEILSFNWNFYQSDFTLWKFSFSFFIFKTNRFSKKIDFFYKKVSHLNVDFTLITDSAYHIKNLYYFNKYKIFSLALISSAIDPWLVSYAIPGLLHGFLTEFFFLKILLILKKQVINVKHAFYKKTWFFIFFKNNNLNLIRQ